MTTIKLPAAINLSYWLYKVHPEIFNALLNSAKGRPSGLGRLGDDFYTGITPVSADSTSFDVGNFVESPSAGAITTTDISSSISPDLVSLPAPATSDFYTGITPMPAGAADAVPDVGNFLANSDATSSGGSSPTAVSSSTASNVGSVASVLTSGLNALAAAVKVFYPPNTPQASTIATQGARAQAGQAAAPITYAYNSAGQLVPVLASASTGTVGALTPQTLSSLGISSTWGLPLLVVGAAVLAAFSGG